jgi:hypothetical protein
MAKNIVEVFRATIKIGAVEIDTYTDHEKDNQGNWINYLSGQGMALAIGERQRTSIDSEMSKALKALLGNDFSCIDSRYRTERGGLVKVKLWHTLDAAKYWGYHAGKGNQKAMQLVIAMVSTTLDIVINDAFNRKYEQGSAQKQVNRILDNAAVWERLYDKAFCDRVFDWFGAQFYWEFVYGFLTPIEICKLNELNPPNKGDCRYRIHQFLEPETRDRLVSYVRELIAICNASEDKQQFLNGYQRHFNKNNQLKLNF